MRAHVGGDAKGHCIPEHAHHVGNVLADKLAEKGKAQRMAHHKVQVFGAGKVHTVAFGYDKNLGCFFGEEPVVLIADGKPHQGGISDALAAAVTKWRISCMSRRAIAAGEENRMRKVLWFSIGGGTVLCDWHMPLKGLGMLWWRALRKQMPRAP